MFRGSANEVNPEAPLNDILSELKFGNVNCSAVQGGGAPDINVEEITVLIILFHGTVQMTKVHIFGLHGPSIDVTKLSSIENLAYLALAPTGLSNIGTNSELTAYKEFTRTIFKSAILQHSVIESLQKIETKADELISQHAKKRKGSDEIHSIFSRICKYCFSYLPDRLLSSIKRLGDLLTNYKFNNIFTVCKSVGTTSLSGGNGMNILKGGTPKHSLSMSNDMFVLMLNEIRLKIKNFDCKRIPELCAQTAQTTPDKYPDYYRIVLEKMQERCRSLHIVKGLGLEPAKLTKFINKDLSYNPTVDGPTALGGGKNMGVIKLQFSIDTPGEVKCSHTPYDAHDVMPIIAYNNPKDNDGVYWSTMEACIAHCTEGDDRSKTTFVIDLTCSSLLNTTTGVIEMFSPGKSYTAYPGGGGGKRIKKKSASIKKTRRIKNKSKSTRYIRNRRNRLKHNKRTKKGRKTKTYRKH
jgi:hypothetical protein